MSNEDYQQRQFWSESSYWNHIAKVRMGLSDSTINDLKQSTESDHELLLMWGILRELNYNPDLNGETYGK